MLVKTLLIALVSFIGFLECGVGNSMIQRPIVMGPLVGLVLGDVNAGLAVGATLELAFMGNVTIGCSAAAGDYRRRHSGYGAGHCFRKWHRGCPCTGTAHCNGGSADQEHLLSDRPQLVFA